jgi:membrane fusion protein (multidrug efflux system)
MYPKVGRLLFTEINVDPGTGKVTLRGEFPNPNAELLPGMFVRVLIEEAIDVDAIAVPAQAVQRTNAGGSMVYVINDQGRAIAHPVRAGRMVGNQIVIEDGLAPGHRVIVDGFQKFTPGSAVTAVAWSGEHGAAKSMSN